MSEFLKYVTGVVRQQSSAARADDDADLLNLAAHLFAIAASIPPHEGAAALADTTARPAPFFSIDQILKGFSARRSSTGGW